MNRWAVLGVLFTARTTMAASFQAVAAILPFMVDDLAMSYGEAGTLIGLFMVPGLFLAIPAGWLAARYGDKPLVVAGAALLVIGSLVMAGAQDFAGAATGRLIAGTGGITLNVLLAKMTTDWFAGREIATAMGLLVSSWPIGLALAMAVFAWLAAAAGWQASLHATAAASAFGLLLIAFVYRPPPHLRTGGAAAPLFRPQPRTILLALAAGLVWGFMNAGAIVFLSFTPIYLVSQGWQVAEAGALASLIVWLCAPMIVVGGRIADRTGKGHAIIAATALVTAALMASLAVLPVHALVIVATGLLWAAAAGPIMALLQILPPAERSAGFGIYFTVFYPCMALMPALGGVMLDVTGSTAVPILFAALVMAATAPALWLFGALARATPPAPA